jgi:hypothetical protein
MNYRIIVGSLLLTAGLVFSTGSNAADIPSLKKIMPTVKKDFFKPHKIKTEDLKVKSPFSPAPAPGIHPRILISPEDLPALRKQLKDTACGRRAISSIRGWLNGAIFKKGAPLKEVFNSLVKGEVDALQKTDNAWWRNQTGLTLCLAAFDAMINRWRKKLLKHW